MLKSFDDERGVAVQLSPNGENRNFSIREAECVAEEWTGHHGRDRDVC